MQRRTVLAALGTASVALAGCVAGRADGCLFPDWESGDERCEADREEASKSERGDDP